MASEQPTTTRRGLLAAGAAASLAGCSSGEAATPTQTATRDTKAAIEERMCGAGIDVVDATKTDQGYDLAYRSEYSKTTMAVVEVAAVAAVYADLIADGHEIPIFAPIITEGGGDIVRYTLESGWAEELHAGERTQVEYLDRVMDYMVGYDGGEI